jgi:hypothetical protein
LKLFQNFNFGTATLDLSEKRALDRFFQNPSGFGKSSALYVF